MSSAQDACGIFNNWEPGHRPSQATVILLHSEERQFAKEKRKMKNLGANFALPLHSKVKKKKKSTFTSLSIAEEIPEN